MFVDKHGRAPKRTRGWEFLFHVDVKSRVLTLRCKHYVVCTDIAYVMAAGSGVFLANPLCTGLEISLMIVSCMFAKGSLGVAIISTPSTGYGNINRMACVHMRGYGILLQNLVT